jgi:hypothetical protein
LLIQDITIYVFEIRGGGNAALLLTKPAASGDACASPQGGRNKLNQACRDPPRKKRKNLVVLVTTSR